MKPVFALLVCERTNRDLRVNQIATYLESIVVDPKRTAEPPKSLKYINYQ